jgi:hypothetical protein
VSRNTLAAIISRHPDLVERERKLASGRFAVLARACSESLLDRVDSLPANVIGIVMGIATDKSLLLDGRPTAITETKRGPTADEINAYIESLPRASDGSSDAQSDEFPQILQQSAGAQPSGSPSGAPAGAQVDRPTAGLEGGGGGRESAGGGEVSMDSDG